MPLMEWKLRKSSSVSAASGRARPQGAADGGEMLFAFRVVLVQEAIEEFVAHGAAAVKSFCASRPRLSGENGFVR